MKSKNRLCIKNLAGALAIPVLVAILLQGICMAKGKTMIMNMTSFDNFVVYIAIVMITTIALSINLNSGRFDFSLGSMALLSSVIGAKITYSFLGGGQGSAPIMLMLTILFGMLLGLISGVLYVVLHLPPIITSLGVTLIYEGILFTITEGRYVMKEVQNSSMTAFTGNWLYAAIIIVAVLVIIIGLFDYTKFGYDYNALKNGQKVAVNTGIKEIPNAIACYVICGGADCAGCDERRHVRCAGEGNQYLYGVYRPWLRNLRHGGAPISPPPGGSYRSTPPCSTTPM